jgi:hypothetical protein
VFQAVLDVGGGAHRFGSGSCLGGASVSMARTSSTTTQSKPNPWGTEIRSCSSPILMQQPAEQVAAVHLGSMISADDGQLTGSVRCLKSEGAVWTMLVVVLV